MKNLRARFGILFFLLCIVSACKLIVWPGQKDVHHTEERAKIFLQKYHWKLIQINGKLPPESPAFLAFRFEKAHFYGNSGCNNLSGNVHMSRNRIEFENIAVTEKACLGTSLMQLEQDFLGLLNKKQFKFDIAEQTLNLYHDDRLVLMFGLVKNE